MTDTAWRRSYNSATTAGNTAQLSTLIDVPEPTSTAPNARGITVRRAIATVMGSAVEEAWLARGLVVPDGFTVTATDPSYEDPQNHWVIMHQGAGVVVYDFHTSRVVVPGFKYVLEFHKIAGSVTTQMQVYAQLLYAEQAHHR